MSAQLKIFLAACGLCVAARLMEYHFQARLSSPQAVAQAAVVIDQTPSDQNVTSGNNFSFADVAPKTNSSVFDLSVGEKLLVEDPTDKNGQAGNFLLSLCAGGQFRLALKFANEAPSDLKSGWVQAVFTKWAQSRPQDAISALASIQGDAERSALFQTIASTWAANNPSALASYAGSLPDGDDKTYALNQIVDSWSMQDPKAFAAWLDTSPSGVNMDQAIAEMVTKTDSANRTPQIAMEWVESINDPTLRYNSLVQVLGQWNQDDPATAQNYLANVSWLNDSQRQHILKGLQTPPIAASLAGD
jgi:hypothetical protein